MLSIIVIAVIAYLVFSKFFATVENPEETTPAVPHPTKAAWESFREGIAPAVEQAKAATTQAKATYNQAQNDKMVAELMRRLNTQLAQRVEAGEPTEEGVNKQQVLDILSELQEEEADN